MSQIPERGRWSAAWHFAVGMLTVFPARPVRVDRAVAGTGMALAPLVGLLSGLAAAGVLVAAERLSGSAPLAAVLAIGTLAWLTRALHLDGLADLADGLGSGRPAGPALEIMKRSDIGPFGVVTLVLTLLAQVAVLAQGRPTGWAALVAAAATGRLAVTWACLPGTPAARPEGLGALVAGTVRPGAATAATAATAVVVTVLGAAAAVGTVGERLCAAVVLLFAAGAGLGAAASLRRRAVRRLGGITGDVLGALVETATTATLLASALLPV